MSQKYNDDDYEKICYICRRPESRAGKMVKMPGDICVCADCMQRTFDAINQSDFSDVLNGINVNNMNMGSPGSDGAKHDGAAADGENGQNGDSDKKDDNASQGNMGGIPNISFLNLNDIAGSRQRIKRKNSKKEKHEPLIDIAKIPAPHRIKEQLDEYVIGQEHAKKVMSVAVYNHYKRIAAGEQEADDSSEKVEIEKSNMLMIGPTGSGKTYLVKTLAKLLDVPLAIADATSLTEAGYIGDDIESVVSKLLAAADNDVDRAETGIIFIDEIDKLAKKRNTNSRDVSGEAVQQGLLKLLEGSEVEVPVGANSKNAMVPLATVNTSNILFICGGAFPELDSIIKERLNKQAAIGFIADLKDKYDNDEDILSKAEVEDIRKFGMIPEFIGRLPIIFTLQGLTADMLAQVLKEPKNAILKQYKKLLEMDEVELVFDDEAIEAIAKKAVEKKTGARALRAIIEEFMLDIMYEIPKDDNIGRVIITKEYIEKTGGPVIEMRMSSATHAIEDRRGVHIAETAATAE